MPRITRRERIYEIASKANFSQAEADEYILNFGLKVDDAERYYSNLKTFAQGALLLKDELTPDPRTETLVHPGSLRKTNFSLDQSRSTEDKVLGIKPK